MSAEPACNKKTAAFRLPFFLLSTLSEAVFRLSTFDFQLYLISICFVVLPTTFFSSFGSSIVRIPSLFLLVVGVRELAAQIVRVFVFLFVLELVLDGDAEVVIFIDMNAAVLFLYARRCQFNDIRFLGFFDVNRRSGCTYGVHQIRVQKLIKYCWEPTVSTIHCRCHNSIS